MSTPRARRKSRPLHTDMVTARVEELEAANINIERVTTSRVGFKTYVCVDGTPYFVIETFVDKPNRNGAVEVYITDKYIGPFVRLVAVTQDKRLAEFLYSTTDPKTPGGEILPDVQYVSIMF